MYPINTTYTGASVRTLKAGTRLIQFPDAMSRSGSVIKNQTKDLFNIQPL